MRRLLPLALILAAAPAFAKLPPLSDDAKAKAAEAAAKTAHGNKVADFQLCNAMNKVATRYLADQQKAGKALKPTETPACADPGPFSYTPPEAKPVEAPGAHSPPATAATPPSTNQPAATVKPTGK